MIMSENNKKLRGIILAGGSGTRLHPLTKAISKQLCPIYDKPMIYYALSVLMQADITEIIIISTPEHTDLFKKLLGDGSQLGIHIEYAVQPKPEGLAQALIIAENFLDGNPSALILGDNLFYGHGLEDLLLKANSNHSGAQLFGYYVNDPHRYGIASFDEQNRIIEIIEKPKVAPSNWAITGLYFYDEKAPTYAKTLEPSSRGELEITDLHNIYLRKGFLDIHYMGSGYSWLDTGTHDSLLDASEFVRIIEKRQSLKIGCIEEIAYMKGWIGNDILEKHVIDYGKSDYGHYLKSLPSRQALKIP